MTPRPRGRIVETIDIPLPRPRSYELESDPDFHECSRRIREHIVFNTPAAFGALVVLSLLGIVLFQALVIIEKIFFPWSATAQADLR